MKNVKDVTLKHYCTYFGDMLDPETPGQPGINFGCSPAGETYHMPDPMWTLCMFYWTDFLAAHCTVVTMGGQPGILLVAEYGATSRNNDPYYSLMFARALAMEIAVKAVLPEAEVLVGENTSFIGNHEFCLFIPADTQPEDISKLYYLMDTYAFHMAPPQEEWDDRNYISFRRNLGCHLTFGPLAGRI